MTAIVNPYARAMAMPIWTDSGFAVPPDVELRRAGDLAALHLIDSTKVLGFVPSKFDPVNLVALIARLRAQ